MTNEIDKQKLWKIYGRFQYLSFDIKARKRYLENI